MMTKITSSSHGHLFVHIKTVSWEIMAIIMKSILAKVSRKSDSPYLGIIIKICRSSRLLCLLGFPSCNFLRALNLLYFSWSNSFFTNKMIGLQGILGTNQHLEILQFPTRGDVEMFLKSLSKQCYKKYKKEK